MKGELNCMWPMLHEESLKKGTEVEIVASCETHYMCKLPDGKQTPINITAVDITDFSPIIDWEQRRYEIAKDAVCAYLSTLESNFRSLDHQAISRQAITFADELIKQLKGE